MIGLIKTVMDVLSWLKGNWKMLIYALGIAAIFGAGFYTAKRWYRADVVSCNYERENLELRQQLGESAGKVELLKIELGRERLHRYSERDARLARDLDLVDLRNRHEAAKHELKRLKELKHVQDWSTVPVPAELNQRLRDYNQTDIH